jgi:hypothetical protein
MGKVNFNKQKASDYCERMKGYSDPDGGNYADFAAAGMLPDAIARIEELEKLLIESEAISLCNFQRYEKAVCDAVVSPAWSDLPEEERAIRLEMSMKMLKCEGKI